MSSSGLRTAGALLLLAVAGLALRLCGLDAMLPQLPEPDNCYLTQVALLGDPSPEAQTHRDYAKYPHLVARLVRLAPPVPEAQPGDPIERHLELAAATSLRPRRAIAWIAAL